MSIFENLKTPSLPQNDSSNGKEKRARQLANSRDEYIWTNTMANVVGVPMSKTVPADDKPTIAWFGQVVEVVLDIIENSIANGIEGNHGKLEELRSIQARFNLIKKPMHKSLTKDSLARSNRKSTESNSFLSAIWAMSSRIWKN